MTSSTHPQTAPNAPGQASLGIFANTVHAPPKRKPATDEAVGASRQWRYQLQRVAQGLLRQERVAHCHRSTMNGEDVGVFTSSKGASYGNLSTCGSVWHCPVCAAKITEGRRQELQAAINAWAGQGGEVYLMSLTFPHQLHQPLVDNLDGFRLALKKFKNSRGYKRIMAEAGAVGSIRALEVTHGKNGWHPHTHDLVFAAKDQMERLRELEMLWIEAVIKAELAERSQVNDMLLAAFDIQNGDYAAEYVAKFGHEASQRSRDIARAHWGASSELTKGYAKIGKRFGGRTPFTLLDDFASGDEKAGELFQEYAGHFKGKRQLFWSPKLREALGLDAAEKSDEELAKDEQPERTLCCRLVKDDWKLVLATNARFQVLEAAQHGGAEGVARLLDSLRGRRRTHSDQYSRQARITFYKRGTHRVFTTVD